MYNSCFLLLRLCFSVSSSFFFFLPKFFLFISFFSPNHMAFPRCVDNGRSLWYHMSNFSPFFINAGRRLKGRLHLLPFANGNGAERQRSSRLRVSKLERYVADKFGP